MIKELCFFCWQELRKWKIISPEYGSEIIGYDRKGRPLYSEVCVSMCLNKDCVGFGKIAQIKK
jgi:hypothetical protein